MNQCMHMLAVPSYAQFLRSWTQYKCNCHPKNPGTGIHIIASIAEVLVGIFLTLFIVATIGWIWTCRITIKRGKLIKKKGEAIHVAKVYKYVQIRVLSHTCRKHYRYSSVSKQGLPGPFNTSRGSGVPSDLL